MPLLIGTVLTHVKPEQAGAAAGILTTTQQFGVASGIAVVGAIFYSALGAPPPAARSCPAWRWPWWWTRSWSRWPRA